MSAMGRFDMFAARSVYDRSLREAEGPESTNSVEKLVSLKAEVGPGRLERLKLGRLRLMWRRSASDEG